MNELASIAAIAAALAIGAASPGPSFLLVARTTVAGGRRAGLASACGIGLGALVFAALALVGLAAALAAVPSLYALFKLAGGLYLLYLGIGIWRGAAAPLRDTTAPTAPAHLRGSFALGFVTQVSNPKTAIVYGGVFAALVPPVAGWAFDAAVLASVVLVETGWYATVALALSAAGTRAAYVRHKARIDRAAGLLLGGLGIRLATSAAAP
ncbi:MAG TPA: LysE family transporter [Dokdonella sp.]|nr:LysE family transporter [Dokdonella sp.]